MDADAVNAFVTISQAVEPTELTYGRLNSVSSCLALNASVNTKHGNTVEDFWLSNSFPELAHRGRRGQMVPIFETAYTASSKR